MVWLVVKFDDTVAIESAHIADEYWLNYMAKKKKRERERETHQQGGVTWEYQNQ